MTTEQKNIYNEIFAPIHNEMDSEKGVFAPKPVVIVKTVYYEKLLKIKNMTWFTTDKDIEDAIRKMGIKDSLKVVFDYNKFNGLSKGTATIYVQYEDSYEKLLKNLEQVEIHKKKVLLVNDEPTKTVNPPTNTITAPKKEKNDKAKTPERKRRTEKRYSSDSSDYKRRHSSAPRRHGSKRRTYSSSSDSVSSDDRKTKRRDDRRRERRRRSKKSKTKKR